MFNKEQEQRYAPEREKNVNISLLSRMTKSRPVQLSPAMLRFDALLRYLQPEWNLVYRRDKRL